MAALTAWGRCTVNWTAHDWSVRLCLTHPCMPLKQGGKLGKGQEEWPQCFMLRSNQALLLI